MSVLPVGFGASGTAAFTIDNSLRFDGSNDYLSRTPGSAEATLTKFCFSTWVKKSALADLVNFMPLLSAGTSSGAYTLIGMSDSVDAKITFVHDGAAKYKSAGLLRDPTAWYHLFFKVDSTTSVGQRFRVWVNGAEWATTVSSEITLNDTFEIGNNVVHNIGRNSVASAYYLDGYLADTYLVCGSSTPVVTDFGETNADGVWVPKAYTGTYGNNGFHLDFSDGTSTTTIGYDAAGSNDWTLTGFTRAAGVSECWMTDTPTNNFATLNPLAVTGSVGTITEGNLKVNTPTPNGGNTFGSIPIPSSGAWWWEVTLASANNVGFIGVSSFVITDTYLYSNTNSVHYGTTGGKYVDGASSAYGSSYTNTDVIGILADSSGTVTFYKQTGGTGNFVSQGAITHAVAGLFPCFSDGSNGNGDTAHFNFGQRTFNYVTQHGSLPSSALALCTANLPAVAIPNTANGFKVTLATEANIYADVATARTGWTDYVDILKNRDAAESWAWQFSHDSTNEYAVQASSLVRQTKRTQSGSNAWVGYSIRIGVTYGTAAGSVSHTNGAATTITHNVGKSSRQMIFLFNRAGGTAVPVYHPDATSGELLDLCATSADAVSTSITSVTSNSFQIGSGVATGTYDYLVIQEQTGFFDLGSYTAASTSDGAYVDHGGRAIMLIQKRRDGVESWAVGDTARSTYNVVSTISLLDLNVAEATGTARYDVLAGGEKLRTTVTPHTSGGVYVTASFVSPFGGSNVSPAPAR